MAKYDNIIDLFEEIGTSISAMMGGVIPVNVAGKEMPSKYTKQSSGGKQKRAVLGYKYKKIR